MVIRWRRRVRRRRARPLTPAQAARREQARSFIIARVEHWSSLMGVKPNRVAIRDQRSRWGSASALGNLNFNWRISRMPAPVCDYIIIHELAHLREMNHSQAYWAIVGDFCHDYKEYRRWLRRNGGRYHRDVV